MIPSAHKILTAKRRFFPLYALALAAGVAMSAPAPALAVEKLVTDRVFHVPDKSSSEISFRMVVAAGCGDEENNDCQGISHYLEHLLLTAKNREEGKPALHFFRDGHSDGETSLRYTFYAHTYPAKSADAAERLDRLFAFYAARLKGFSVTPDEAEHDRKIVLQERHWRAGRVPSLPLEIAADGFLYGNHPLSQLPMGTPEGIARFTVERAREFHARWYRLSNVWFIVTGPVEETVLKTIAEKHLAGLDRTAPPPRHWLAKAPELPDATKIIEGAVEGERETSISLRRSFNFPDDDPVRVSQVMDIINQLLASKFAASPHGHLVDRAEIASAIRDYGVFRVSQGRLAFYLGAVAEPGVAPARIADSIRKYLRELAAQGLDDDMVERLRQRDLNTYHKDLENPQTAANRLTKWLTAGFTHDDLARAEAVMKSVSTAEVNALLKAMAGSAREIVVIKKPGTETIGRQEN